MNMSTHVISRAIEVEGSRIILHTRRSPTIRNRMIPMFRMQMVNDQCRLYPIYSLLQSHLQVDTNSCPFYSGVLLSRSEDPEEA